jgi:hypothetical protein
MITNTIRPPFTDDPHATQRQIDLLVSHAIQQLDGLLAHKNALTPDTFLKLTIEKRFLKIRHIYHAVFSQIL